MFKFFFCFHRGLCHICFQLWNKKALQNRLLLTLFITRLIKGFMNYWYGQELFKFLSVMTKWCCYFFIISKCYISWSRYTMKTETSLLQWFTIQIFKANVNLMVRSTKEVPQIKRITSYVNVQLSSKSSLCFLNLSSSKGQLSRKSYMK